MIGLAVTLSLVLWGGVALAGSHGPGHGSGPFGFFGLDHGAHEAIQQLIQDLKLNEDQNHRLESVHGAMMQHRQGAGDAHEAHLQVFIERLESGYMDPAEVRQAIDQHVEKIRLHAYSVSDPLVELFNSLDADQRQTLVDHLKQARAHAEHHRRTQGHHGGDHH